VKGNEPDDSDLQGIHPRRSSDSLGSFTWRIYETHQRLHSAERSLSAPVQQDQAKTTRVAVGTTVWFQVLHSFNVWTRDTTDKICSSVLYYIVEKSLPLFVILHFIL